MVRAEQVAPTYAVTTMTRIMVLFGNSARRTVENLSDGQLHVAHLKELGKG